MAESKRFEREPAEGSRSTIEKQLKQEHSGGEESGERREPNETGRRKRAEQD